MGSSESKLKSNDGKGRTPTNSLPSTPIKCIDSNLENISHLDPRSPSEDIFRTPIEVPKPKEANNTAVSLSKLVIDPRSPTDQFERTPILIKEDDSHRPKKLHNKILDNARRNIIYTPIQTSKTKTDSESEKFEISPPKLISSVPSFKKCNEKRKSFVGLLETNIDFTETNLDDIVRNKSLNESLSITINETPICDIVEHKNCDPRSPSKDFLRTPIQIVHKIGEVDLNTTTDKCEPKKVPDGMNYSSESLLKLADENVIESEISGMEILSEEIESHTNDRESTVKNEEVPEIEINEHMLEEPVPVMANMNDVPNDNSDKIENTELIMAEIVQDLIGNVSTLTTEEIKVIPYVDELEIKEPIIDLTADVQEFDKKLTKIIQENNDTFSFKKMTKKEYLSDKTKKRTPMKDRNEISEPKRNKLKVSDKPRKLNYDISRIPVFRDRNGVKVQCENTPPSDINLRNRKTQPKWDSDKTLVI